LIRQIRDRIGEFLFVFVGFALIAAYPGRVVQAQAPMPKSAIASAGNAENGKKLFKSYGCYQCHGYAGQGGAGPRIGPRPIPFQALVQYVRTPKNQMPPYTSEVLKDSELTDIYAFLQSLPEPPKVKDILLLNND